MDRGRRNEESEVSCAHSRRRGRACFGLVAAAGGGPVERWADAVGGRDKVAAITSIYREATIEFADYRGTLKVWHTSDGKYRKEEQAGGIYALVETFDGTNGMVELGSASPRTMTAAV